MHTPIAGRRRLVAGTVALTLLVTLSGQEVAAAAGRGGGLAPDAEVRRQALAAAPETESEHPVPSREVAPAAVPTRAPMGGASPAEVAWPEAGVEEVDPGAEAVTAEPGGMPVTVATPNDVADLFPETAVRALTPQQPASAARAAAGVPASDELTVETLDRDAAEAAGVDGVLLQVAPVEDAAADGEVALTLGYEGFASAYGGDWSSRLGVVRLPECALTDPDRRDCRTQTPVPSVNDPEARTVTALVPTAGTAVLALAASTSGAAGRWSATPLAPSASWQVSGQTGDFTWAYPMRVPPALNGPEPDLALTYSSGSVDGRVASTNNQSSSVGDGWDLASSFVERKYVACTVDATGNANNVTRRTGDLCWQSDNASIVLDGRASELVRDAVTGAWRMKQDDGTRIERLTGGWNDDNDTEHWKVTTTDGTQYFFGRGKRSASDALALNSAWSVPVYGNHPGEPCYASTFAASMCRQTWRWNLDYVVDTSGNTMTYVYAKETNRYGRNLNTAVSEYTSGGYLTRVDYGQRVGTETSTGPTGRVVLGVAERCLPSGSITCDPSQLTSANARHWPDVPFDLVCTSTTTCPAVVSPAFFSRKRLVTVTTQVRAGTTFQNVDRWTLTHTFPDTGDTTSRTLWLDGIKHEGLVGGTIALPKVRFHGVQMANRVDTLGDAGPPMNRYRINAIDTEAGATISVNYSPQDCTVSSLPASPDTNTRRCFPVRWQPEGTGPSIQEYFHKYVVTTVSEDGRDGESAATETRYEYVDGPAWRFDDNPLVEPAHRTWGQFRGYATVDVVTGAPSDTQHSRTRTRYFRGMDGDRLAGGGTRAAAVDGIVDSDRLNGFVREEITYDGLVGPEVSAEVSTPWVSSPTATAADGTPATLLGVGEAVTRTAAPALPGGLRTTRTLTTYDSTYGLPTRVDDLGDLATGADDRCTRTEYVRNTAAHIVATVRRTETVAVSCGATPQRPVQVVADVRLAYDGGAVGAAPTRGLVTSSQQLSGYSGSIPQYVTEQTTTYDVHGRATSVKDALGRTTTTAYKPAAGGPVTATTQTSPDPDGSGALTPQVTVTEVHPAWGSPVKQTDPNGKITSASLDALGRTTGVWLPGRAQGSATAHTTYQYVVSSTGPNSVTTKTLTAGQGYLTRVELYDGLLRLRQTQRPSAQREEPGRVVTDTLYDSRGLVAYQRGDWFTTGSPSTTVIAPTGPAPQRVRYLYDGVGRAVSEIVDIADQERWRTTTSYGGDRVSVTPPAGGVTTTTIRDARDRVVELRQFPGGEPSGAFTATAYTYDLGGRLATVTDAAGNRWSSTYDIRGRLVTQSDPDRGVTTSTFDDAGQIVTSTDARGVTSHHTRDQLGRVTEVRDGSATGALRASWVYDTKAKGQLTSATRHSGGAPYTTTVTGYDNGYRPLGQTVTVPSTEGALAGSYTTSYTYTVDGQLLTVRLPAAGGLEAETVTTRYDALSLPEWMSGGLGWGMYVASSMYDVYGEPTRYGLGNADGRFQFANWSYEDGTRRLAQAWTERQGGTGNDTSVKYTYDAAGNPTSVVDRPTAGPVDAQCFRYDGLRRLTQAWTPADGACATAPSVAGLGGPAPYWLQYGFDAVGNRTSETSRSAAGATTRTYTYPAPGSPRPHAVMSVVQSGSAGAATSSYVYDEVGGTVSRALAGQPAQTLAWDGDGRLSEVKEGPSVTGSYVYDAAGQRLVRREGGTTTLYLPGGMELRASGSTVRATRYYAFGGRTVAVRTGPGAAGVSTVVSDPHGTATLVMSTTTGVVTQRRHDPYGNPRGGTPVWPGDRGFLDKPVDGTGLGQVGARYYDASIGRFISVDPVMDLSDPQQWAAYSYANNNPVTYSDPTGLAPRMVGDWAPRSRAKSQPRSAPGSRASTGAGAGRGPYVTRPALRAAGRSSGASEWVSKHRGLLATVGATAGCVIPGVGWGACAGLQAAAFAVRSQQTVSAGGGWNRRTAGAVALDGTLTGVGFGLGAATAAGFARVAQLNRFGQTGALPGAGAAANSADEALAAARAQRDALVAEVGSSKATVTGGYDPARGPSSAVSGCNRNPLGCAENDVQRQLGIDPSDIQFTEAIRPRTGQQVPICHDCQVRYDPSQFPAGTLHKPGGRWDELG